MVNAILTILIYYMLEHINTNTEYLFNRNSLNNFFSLKMCETIKNIYQKIKIYNKIAILIKYYLIWTKYKPA